VVEHRESAEKLLAAGDTDERLHSRDNAAAKPVRKAILAGRQTLFRAAIRQGQFARHRDAGVRDELTVGG
jgi:hypothetical protein